MSSPVRPIAIILVSVLSCLVSYGPGTLGQSRSGRQDQAEVVKVYTELVQTDVMVFDKKGRFADGLRKDDFELRVDGKVRPIEFFERVTAGSVNEESQLLAARGSSSSDSRPVAVPLDRGRTIFFFVDDAHLSPEGVASTRKLITGFIEKQMMQNDEVAITSTSGQIGFLEQLTNNKAVLRKALERIKHIPYVVKDFDRPVMSEYQAQLIDKYDRDLTDYFVGETMRQNPGINRIQATGIVQARATTLLQQAGNVTRFTFVGLESLVKSSSKLSGRKLVFLVSDGFFLDSRNTDSFDRLKRITSYAAKNGVVIYSLDARGLVAMLDDPTVPSSFDPTGTLARASQGELLASQDALNALARDTGGRPVFNTNNLEVGLSAALKETSVYYLLAWKPEQAGRDTSKFRRIEVKLKDKPDLNVRVRRGFFDVEPADKDTHPTSKPIAKSAETEIREAILSQFPERGLPISIALNYVSEPDRRILLSSTVEIPGEFLSFNTENGKKGASVRIAGLVYNDRGQPGARFDEVITVPARETGKNSFIYSYPIFLSPGLYQVRVAARDEKSRRTGSTHAWVEIPDLTSRKLTLSSLIIGRRRENGPAASNTSADDFGLSVDRQFERNSVLRFLIFVYNAARAAESQPDVAVQVQVLRDNQPVVTTALKKISNEGVDLARLPYAAELGLEELPAGQYVLQVTVIDRVSKSSASQQVSFVIA